MEIVQPTVVGKLYQLFQASVCLIPVVGWGIALAKNRTDQLRIAKLADQLARSRLEAMGETVSERPVRQARKVQRKITRGLPNGSEKAYAMRVNAEGLAAFREYGRLVGKLPKQKDQYTLKEVGDTLAHTFNASPACRQDNFFYGMVWCLTHPLKLLTHIQGMGIFNNPVTGYNPYENGNVTTTGWSYQVGRNIPFYFGPGPGIKSDRTFDAYMEKMQGEQRVHLQHCLENPLGRGEKERRLEIGQFQETYGDHFRLYATPMNGPAWEMKGEFLKWDKPEEFIEKYKAFALKDLDILDKSTGFYLGKDVMTEAQFVACFDKAKAFAQLPNAYQPDKKTLGKGLQVLVQALISLQALENLPEEAVFAQACKEDIDRGVVSNIAVRLLVMAKNGESITQESLEELVGVCFGRADLVSQKRIVQDKFEALLAFTYLLSGVQAMNLW
ncbi:MAG: hypothetical protein KDK65_06595 [Chlamydiia bacterium]|nr:hypothetical protein [Chlamydiia bacterium]